MELILTNNPAARGGIVKVRRSHKKEMSANRLANMWANRNLTTQSLNDLQKAQSGLIACGVVPNNPMFDRPSRLLTAINSIIGYASI